MQKALHSNDWRYLLSILSRASKNNQKFILLLMKKLQYKPILAILHSNGFIQSFEERGKFLLIRLKQTYWKNHKQPIAAIQKITKIPRLHNKYSMSSKHIQKLASLNNHAYCYIFSTDCGIMPGRLAEKKKNWRLSFNSSCLTKCNKRRKLKKQ